LAWTYANEVVRRMPELAEFEVRIKLDITIERPGSRHLLWRFLREGGGFGEAILEPLHQRVSELGALILRKVIVTKLLVFEKTGSRRSGS